MTDNFLPAVPGECLPCECPRELMARIARRAGVRPMVRVVTGSSVRAYCRNDRHLSDVEVEQISRSSHNAVIAALNTNELPSFVQSAINGNYYRIPSVYWGKLACVGEVIEPAWEMELGEEGASGLPDPSDMTRSNKLDAYQHCSLIDRNQAEFLGQPILVAKRDGDELVGGMSVIRPVVSTTVSYAPNSNADENEAVVGGTGFAGRPTKSRDRIIELLKKRHAERRTNFDSLAGEVKDLLAEFAADPKNKGWELPMSGTTENSVRLLYNRFKGSAQWPDRGDSDPTE